MNWLKLSKSKSENDGTNSITLTRALTELKTLDKRIQKTISESQFCSVQGQLRKPETKALSAQSNYDKIRDLMSRRLALKSAIVTSNANTKIRVCGMDLTVAEAIELKSSIKNYKSLLNTMQTQYGYVSEYMERENSKVRSNLENSLGNNNSDNNNMDNVADYSKNYMKVHGLEIYDPLKLSEKVEDLGNFITEFEDEVDFVLSEKNATTTISI